MTHELVQSLRSSVERARACSLFVGEETANLDHLCRLSDEDFAETLTVEDMAEVYLAIPAFRR